MVIPFHSSKANTPTEAQPLWTSIINEFNNFGVKINETWADNINYESYSARMWLYLESIDKKLKTNPKDRIIPESLVELLYDYAMPVPFLDVEEYCSKLVGVLEKEIQEIIIT